MEHIWKLSTALLYYCMLHHCVYASECHDQASNTLSVVVLPPCAISRDSKAAYTPRSIKLQYTPLQAAAAKGNASVVEELLRQGHDANERNARGDTALHLAITAGHADVVYKLVNYGANVYIRGHDLFTPLIYAAEKGDETLVHYLLQNGANAYAYDMNKDTPLIVAARGGFINVVNQLIGHFSERVGVDAIRDQINAASIEAFDKRRMDIFSAITKRYEIDKKTTEACMMKIWNEESFWLLADAFPEFVMNALNILLNSAVGEGRCNIVRTIIAGVTVQQSTLDTALYNSASLGNVECIKGLVAAGANVNVYIDEKTPLYAAADSGHDKSMKILLDAGADPNIHLWKNNSPLMAAFIKNCCNCVKLLLTHGANFEEGEIYARLNYSISDDMRQLLEKYENKREK